MKRKPPKNDAQLDLFAPIFGDIAMRDEQKTMELPFFSLSKSPRFKAIRYKNERRSIEVIITGGEPFGIANIWDKDILIWCMSQVREAADRGEPHSKTVWFRPAQLLKDIRRGHGKKDYLFMEKGCKRLHNSAVHTTIRTDEKTYQKGFHWIEDYSTHKDNTEGDTAGLFSITLSDWLYGAALNNNLILTLDDDYFLLTGGLERWLYLVARKHAGYQDTGFPITMKALYDKSGSAGSYRKFKYLLAKIAKRNDLPGYHIDQWRAKNGEDYLSFVRRGRLSFDHPGYATDIPRWVKKMRPENR